MELDGEDAEDRRGEAVLLDIWRRTEVRCMASKDTAERRQENEKDIGKSEQLLKTGRIIQRVRKRLV